MNSFELSGAELLRELAGSPFLPHYNTQLIRAVSKEMNDHFLRLHHYSSLSADNTQDRHQFWAAWTLYSLAFWRNRRFVLSYLLARTKKLTEFFWFVDAERVPVEDKLSAHEISYCHQYRRIMGDYFREIGYDLLKGLSPPESSLVAVRVNENFARFEKGREYLVRPNEIERGIYKGWCDQI